MRPDERQAEAERRATLEREIAFRDAIAIAERNIARGHARHARHFAARAMTLAPRPYWTNEAARLAEKGSPSEMLLDPAVVAERQRLGC